MGDKKDYRFAGRDQAVDAAMKNVALNTPPRSKRRDRDRIRAGAPVDQLFGCRGQSTK